MYQDTRCFVGDGNLKKQVICLVKKPTNRPRKFDRKELLAYVETNPDKYPREIGEVFGCSDMAIHKALKAMGISLKKRP